MDAFQRQLKRFDIKVSGSGSDMVEKFFSTADSSALFPEYISRAVRQGIEENDVLSRIVATKTKINGLDYRTIETTTDTGLEEVEEGETIPTTTISTQENLIKLTKRGRMLEASYEAIRFQKLDLITITLKQIGSGIATSLLSDAVDVLIDGDGNDNTACTTYNTATAGTVTYGDLLNLWSNLSPYKLNCILASPEMMLKMLSLSEFRDAAAGLDFHATGRLITPFGAELISSSLIDDDELVGFDRRYALEMVESGEVLVESDKLIDCQLERTAITIIAGFSKIFADAAAVLSKASQS